MRAWALGPGFVVVVVVKSHTARLRIVPALLLAGLLAGPCVVRGVASSLSGLRQLLLRVPGLRPDVIRGLLAALSTRRLLGTADKRPSASASAQPSEELPAFELEI